jgi:hypothetical protein
MKHFLSCVSHFRENRQKLKKKKTVASKNASLGRAQITQYIPSPSRCCSHVSILRSFLTIFLKQIIATKN